MKATEVHYLLIMAVEKVLKFYRDDLFVHDLSALESDANRNREVSSFFYRVNEYGTVLDFLRSIADYPCGDNRVPYLFGSVNKFELLETTGYSLKVRVEGPLYYYNAGTLRLVSIDEAEEILAAYKADMQKRLKEREE